MGEQKSIYREFSKRSRALAAVRALLNVGVEPTHVEAVDLPAMPRPTSDADLGPRRKAFIYSMNGLVMGAILGFALGLSVFWWPAHYLIGSRHFSLITGVGIFVCGVAGSVAGVLIAIVLVNRRAKARLSSGAESSVEVRVWSDDDKELKRARSVLSMSHLKKHGLKGVRYNNGNDTTH